MRRKCLLISVVILFAVGVLVSSSYAEIDPGTIVGIWLFDEGEGDTAGDSSGNGHDGTLVDGPEWVGGESGTALKFDGTNGVHVPHSDELTLSSFTLAAWIKLDEGNAWQQIVTKGNSPPRNYSIGVSPANLFSPYFTVGGDWLVMDAPAGETPVVDSKWHHVAATYDGEMILGYVDGVLEAEVPFTDEPDVNTFPVEFGSGGTGSVGQVESIRGGTIDEVLICNTALTEDEIGEAMEGLAAVLAVVEPAGKLTAAWGGVKAAY